MSRFISLLITRYSLLVTHYSLRITHSPPSSTGAFKILNPNSKNHGRLQVFCPRHFCETVTEITAADLREMGVEAVLLDLDNTLVGWQRHDVQEPVREWLMELKDAGLKLCLISDTRFGRRLRALSEELDIPFVRRAWKPRKKGFLRAMQDLGVTPEQTVMFGDQMFTDILG